MGKVKGMARAQRFLRSGSNTFSSVSAVILVTHRQTKEKNKEYVKTGEMAQKFGALAPLPEYPILFPPLTITQNCNSSSRMSNTHTDIQCRQNTNTHKRKINH